ncbi:MAG: hypothetical protein GX605_08080, partial [Chloroflexi bacterium]|nr:hypothetical protein [Chloroflexota bacterium]
MTTGERQQDVTGAPRPGSSGAASPLRDTLAVALPLGITTGLVEGAGLWALQRLGWLQGLLTFHGSSVEIIWIAALVDLLLFGALGLALGLLGTVFPTLPTPTASLLVFVFLALFDWLALALLGRVALWALAILSLGLAWQACAWAQAHQQTTQRLLRSAGRWLGGIGLLAFAGIQGGQLLAERLAVSRLSEADPNLPNVVLIVVDTLRADHLSSFG